MIKIRFCIAVLCCAATLSSAAAASASRFFSGGFMGLNIPPGQPGPAFAGSLGFRLAPQWRLAGEISFAERNSHLATVNLYYDMDVGSARFQPFLTVGAGLAESEIHRGSPGLASEASSGMAWQAGGGMNYQLNDRLSLSGGYRHTGMAATDHNGPDHGHDSHELRFGMTYKLPVRRNIGLPSGGAGE
jgi:hypothetical protein